MNYSIDKRTTIEHVNKKWVRVLTVITYILLVSVVALVLGIYYKLAWNPKYETESDSKFGVSRISLGNFNMQLNENKSLKVNTCSLNQWLSYLI